MALRVHIPTGLMNSSYQTQIIPASSSSSSSCSSRGGKKSLIIEARRSLKQKQTKEKEKDEKKNYYNIPNFDLEMTVLELERMFRSSRSSDPLTPQYSGPFSPSPSIGFSGRPIRVAYQGVRGSYCQEAALKAFPSSSCDTFACCNSMEDAFKALEDKSADRAIIPVENSIDGIIDRNLDLLLRHDNVEIVGELIIPVNHCLLAMPGTSRSQLKRIVSHPQALSHCKSKLEWLDLEVDEVSNAADVARYVSENRITDTAVIGSKIAAKEFGLTVLEENFQDDRNENFNRFLQLGLEKTCSSSSSSSSSFGLNKTVTTVAFCLEKGVSDLYRALAIFGGEKGNITVRRVEQRPNRLNPVKKTGEHRYFDYVFILDLEVENNVLELKTALSRLEEISGFIRVLGSYKSGYCRGARGVPCRVNSVDEGEAQAAAEAYRWAKELGFEEVIIEGDSSNIISFLNFGKEDIEMDWRAVNVLKPIKERRRSEDLGVISFLKVPRSANKSADAIARIAKLLGDPTTWSELEIPSFLFDVISADSVNNRVIHPGN